MDKPVLYIWNWVGGGYNSCTALDRAEALRKARAMTPGTTLVLIESSLHVGTYEELRKLDAQFNMD